MARTVSALCLVAGLFCLPGLAHVTRADRPESTEARANSLCGYDGVITTLPASPGPGDSVQVLCAAVWSDSCVPVYACHAVQGGTIRVISVCDVPPGIACLTVMTPFCNVATVGPLPAGTYRVEWYILDLRCDYVLRLCAIGRFEVAHWAHSTYLPLLCNGAAPGAAASEQ